MNRRLTVLIASPDRDYLRLAQIVLRLHGHLVYTTSVKPDRLRRQVRLREPDILLIDCDSDTVAQFRSSLTAPHAVAVLRAYEGPTVSGAPADGSIGKWVSPSCLANAVARAADQPPASGFRTLRLAGS